MGVSAMSQVILVQRCPEHVLLTFIDENGDVTARLSIPLPMPDEIEAVYDLAADGNKFAHDSLVDLLVDWWKSQQPADLFDIEGTRH